MKLISKELGLWRREASGPKKAVPVLFVHGMWGWHWVWSGFIDAFATSGYDCYTVDLIGHGPVWEEPIPGGLPSSRFVEQIRQAVARIASEAATPVLVGHSMGGLLVQKAAESISAPGIALIATAAPRGIFSMPLFRTAWIYLKYLAPAFFNRPVRPTNDELLYLVFHKITGNELQTALERVVPESGRVYREMMLECVVEDFNRITCPVLVMGGGKDRIISVRVLKKLAEKYRAPLRIFEDGSHWLVREEGWRNVCGALLEWIASIRT